MRGSLCFRFRAEFAKGSCQAFHAAHVIRCPLQAGISRLFGSREIPKGEQGLRKMRADEDRTGGANIFSL